MGVEVVNIDHDNVLHYTYLYVQRLNKYIVKIIESLYIKHLMIIKGFRLLVNLINHVIC